MGKTDYSYIKLIKSGDLIEVLQYENIPLKRKPKKKANLQPNIKRVRGVRRADNARRQVTAFRRLLRTNLERFGTPSLLTLTFAVQQGGPTSSREFKIFMQRLRHEFGRDFGYIAVQEYQKRGAIHFHVLIWNFPLATLPCLYSDKTYVDKTGKSHKKHICPDDYPCERKKRIISTIWGNGWVDFMWTDGSPKLLTYLSKYFTKSLKDPRLAHQKTYFKSRNLWKPIVITDPTIIEWYKEIWSNNLSPETSLRNLDFHSQWLGKANYASYKLNNKNNEI